MSKTGVKGLVRRFVIQGNLVTLNQFINATRANRQGSARIKQEQEQIIGWAIKKWLGGWRTDRPVFIRFVWIEKNKKKDKDNICFAKKFILDALVKSGTIKNDAWDNIDGFEDCFFVDKNNPRIEVEILEL